MTRPGERKEFQALQHALDRRVAGQVGFDSVSRILYSTDASNHQVEPIGVVTPRSDEGLQAALEVAREFGVTVVARGAGTGLAGQAIGRGLIVDTSRHLRRILNIDQEARTVTVEPGAVLATVNQALAPHGLMVGPDPASADRATVGGMIGTNASGAHSICYGMTADHLVAAEVYLSDGPVARLESLPLEEAVRRSHEGAGVGRILAACLVVRQRYAAQIAERWPHTWRRASGYGLNYLNGYMPASPPSWDGQAQPYARPDQVNLCGLLCGSEGTLAVVRNASLRVVPRPGATVLVVLSYGSVTEACDEAPNMLSARPASVELIPQSLLHRAQGIPAYARRLSFVEGDPAALLVVEFTGASMAEALSAGQRLGSAGRMLAEPAAQADLWAVRKVGLGLLMSVAGDTKPVEFIEDVAVPVERLGEYTRRVDEILREHGTFGEWYAHASAGCLHMRPMLNLKSVEGVRAMASIGRAVAQVALDMHGSLSGEHGDGLSRTQYNELLFGPDLMQAFREVKQAFDPAGLLNPGKVIPESRGPTAPDRPASLRYAPGYKVTPVATVMAFRREGDFAHAVELCNGAGVCLKTTGVMCPSFQATRDEAASTRGRANVLRAAMSGLLATEGLAAREVFQVLDLCLECKGCKAECASAVDMARLKSEFLHAWHVSQGLPLRSRLFGNIARLSRAGTRFAPLVNATSGWRLTRRLGQATLGLAHQRPFPRLAGRRFSEWFGRHPAADSDPTVVLFLDTYTETMVPEIGRAAVEVLEAAGYRVQLAEGQSCCGRPMISKGMLAEAKRAAEKNLAALHAYAQAGVPILGLEPSCILTLRDEYLEFFPDDRRAQGIAGQALLIEEFLTQAGPSGERPIDRLSFGRDVGAVAFHGHCFVKSMLGSGPTRDMLRAACGLVEEIDSGCCGMAGSFGYEQEHYDLSRRVAEMVLLPAVRRARAEGRLIAAAGMSCRSQVFDGTGVRPLHPIQVVAGSLRTAGLRP